MIKEITIERENISLKVKAEIIKYEKYNDGDLSSPPSGRGRKIPRGSASQKDGRAIKPALPARGWEQG